MLFDLQDKVMKEDTASTCLPLFCGTLTLEEDSPFCARDQAILYRDQMEKPTSRETEHPPTQEPYHPSDK